MAMTLHAGVLDASFVFWGESDALKRARSRERRRVAADAARSAVNSSVRNSTDSTDLDRDPFLLFVVRGLERGAVAGLVAGADEEPAKPARRRAAKTEPSENGEHPDRD